jgi:hypothetical protein
MSRVVENNVKSHKKQPEDHEETSVPSLCRLRQREPFLHVPAPLTSSKYCQALTLVTLYDNGFHFVFYLILLFYF